MCYYDKYYCGNSVINYVEKAKKVKKEKGEKGGKRCQEPLFEKIIC
jgi:hypothetical protein